MDTWGGVNAQPITLNKYLYANADPVMYTDPSGHFVSLSGLSAANSIRGIVSTIAQASIRGVVNAGARGLNALKKRPWVIYRVTLGQQYLSHEYLWAMNRYTKKGIGYHVSAPRRSVLHSARSGEYVEGLFSVLSQKRANKMFGKSYPMTSKKAVGYLGRFGFMLWTATTVGHMREGDSCKFSYHIPKSNCITWTAKATKSVKWWMLFPI